MIFIMYVCVVQAQAERLLIEGQSAIECKLEKPNSMSTLSTLSFYISPPVCVISG